MVDSLPVVALAELLPYQTAHHDLDPLLPDDGILCLLEALGVLVVDAVECGSDLGLLGQKGLGFGSRHCGKREDVAGGLKKNSKSRWPGIEKLRIVVVVFGGGLGLNAVQRRVLQSIINPLSLELERQYFQVRTQLQSGPSSQVIGFCCLNSKAAI